METAQLLLLGLLAFLVAFVALTLTLVARGLARRDARSREARALEEAEPRVAERLAMLRQRPVPTQQARRKQALLPPASPAREPMARATPLVAAVVLADPRRRIWRDASGALVVLALLGLLAAAAYPMLGGQSPAATPMSTPGGTVDPLDGAQGTPSATDVAVVGTGLPTRAPAILPTDQPTPTLPLTGTPPPTAAPTAKPTAKPTATPTAPTPTPSPTPTASPSPTPSPTPTPTPTPLPLPVASFTCTQLVPDPLQVAFTSTSTDATSWTWDFGDSTSDTQESPTHTFPAAGPYQVTLTVSNATGTSTVTQTVGPDPASVC